MHWHSGWWGMHASMAVFRILIIAAVIWFIRGRTGAKNTYPGYATPDESPLDILQKRYAAGEIDKEEYLEIKSELQR